MGRVPTVGSPWSSSTPPSLGRSRVALPPPAVQYHHQRCTTTTSGAITDFKKFSCCLFSLSYHSVQVLIYLSRYLDQEQRRDLFGLRVKLPPVTQGRRQKNFLGGRQRKKDRKIAKKHQKIALLSRFYYICIMYENPGEGMALPPAADAHAVTTSLTARR